MSSHWTADRIPDQAGRTAVVTGANSGLGLETARELARHGARVVLACRDTVKGERALHEILSSAPGARVEVEFLDLASLDSIRDFAEALSGTLEGIDLLINNAGVMASPRRLTADGFELQLGTNLLGHFALTGRLLTHMQGREGARVVTLSSNAHKLGRINFDDLQSERRYNRWLAYNQSKLADLMFALELDRRLRAAGAAVKS
ncbi:MAG TPA: oxidoreductase, partial [Solirubrobacteraceae bacterium]|nr:oxidoreductase [Solirubrobacteraceae bacterium]